jgi:hypothetical protein
MQAPTNEQDYEGDASTLDDAAAGRRPGRAFYALGVIVLVVGVILAITAARRRGGG